MNDNLKRLRPREKVELHPRLFRQVLNPFEQLAHSLDSPLKRLPHCIGHFWDNDRKLAVIIKFGTVTVFFPYLYRAASSVAVSGSSQFLSRVEGAAPYEFSANEHRPQRSEDGAEWAEKSPGTYVIPGQVATDCQKC
jgi:hypothetical protein